MNNKLFISSVFFLLLLNISCSKKENTDPKNQSLELKQRILVDVAKVCKASYEKMAQESSVLLTEATALNSTTKEDHLQRCREAWKVVRATWERSEAWLFGPIKEIDPQIDTWPINFLDLNNVLNGSDDLTETYVANLSKPGESQGQYSLRGFHPIEYLLWGPHGDKKVSDFTLREKKYLVALCQNLDKLAKQVRDDWTGNYAQELATAGKGSTQFKTMHDAYYEFIKDGMIKICEEVADEKMGKIMEGTKDEESPFAKNSLTDFINNIKGVMDLYQGKFMDLDLDGSGIEDLLREMNTSLDAEIKNKYNAAISALESNGLTNESFGRNKDKDQARIQIAIDKINELKETLENKLIPFVQQRIK